MFGGVKGRSALNASWEAALEAVHAKSQDPEVSALSMDIHKCFDMMSREVVFVVGMVSGMPRGLLMA
eukprot:1747451-Alexandrium_andersonii.AAC.1